MENTQITELSHLAREVYFESKLQHSDAIKLNIHFQDRSHSTCPVDIPRLGLKYAISNVIANAIKASGERGDIFIELKNQGWKCVLDVVDHGAGMDPQLMHKLMRQQQPTDVPELQSLGLYNASKLIRSAHGSLSFESHPGQGTRVRIELPLLPVQSRKQEA